VDCAICARLEARRLSLEFRFGDWMDGFKLVELMVDTNRELWVGSSVVTVEGKEINERRNTDVGRNAKRITDLYNDNTRQS